MHLLVRTISYISRHFRCLSPTGAYLDPVVGGLRGSARSHRDARARLRLCLGALNAAERAGIGIGQVQKPCQKSLVKLGESLSGSRWLSLLRCPQISVDSCSIVYETLDPFGMKLDDTGLIRSEVAGDSDRNVGAEDRLWALQQVS